MDSRDLFILICNARKENGETTPRLNDYHARLVDELEGEHYESFVVQNVNKTETTYYRLTIEQCMLVGMRESKAVRRSVLAKLKELEQKEQFQIPQTLPEALQLAADLALKIEQDKPKIEVYERLADRKSDVSTTVLAKQLGTTAIKLNRWLREIGAKWMQADLPKAGYQDWFNVVADVKNGHEFTQCLVTPHGQLKIAEKWEVK
jgi:phage antirepressor YoqD-like protein